MQFLFIFSQSLIRMKPINLEKKNKKCLAN